MPICGKRGGNLGPIAGDVLHQVDPQVPSQGLEGDGVGAFDLRVEPIAESEKGLEGRRIVCPQKGRGGDKVAAVSDEIPETREAAHALHGGEIEFRVLQNLVWRM